MTTISPSRRILGVVTAPAPEMLPTLLSGSPWPGPLQIDRPEL